MYRALAMIALTACGSSSSDDGPCTCTPGNVAHAKAIGADAPITGEGILASLRRHRQEVRDKANPRAIKIHDDELRFQIVDFCQPCSSWVQDRMTMEQMFPFDQLDNARTAVCMGLVLQDGTTAYGETRPAACRR